MSNMNYAHSFWADSVTAGCRIADDGAVKGTTGGDFT